jgi:hypothetical protein
LVVLTGASLVVADVSDKGELDGHVRKLGVIEVVVPVVADG